ncbi:hypothetical protein ACJRO7_003011 [Eucalyptus globulus]|uniref:Phorbol-ester/DAG-type domain-containing protein n=1 Tax=Eucalyptus globulus TaxID=34317 RepID=A0ABD3IUN1_EUCGL
MSEARGRRIHPEHELVLMMQHDPFFCSACRQIGFGSAYGCKLCLVLVHRKCMYPPPKARHPLQDNCRLEYNPQTSETSDACTFCGACSLPLHGGTYGSNAAAFHPPCLHLEKSINVNNVELHLVASCASVCNWCKRTSISRNKVQIPSWWYVSMCANHNFHVACVRSMMVESWKNGDIAFTDEDDNDGKTSMSTEMPGKQKGKKRRFVRRTIFKVSIIVGISALTGDPSGIFGGVLVYLVSKLFGRPLTSGR